MQNCKLDVGKIELIGRPHSVLVRVWADVSVKKEEGGAKSSTFNTIQYCAIYICITNNTQRLVSAALLTVFLEYLPWCLQHEVQETFWFLFSHFLCHSVANSVLFTPSFYITSHYITV